MLTPDFKEFVQSLNDNVVRFLIVGGYAVAFHGHPRFTKDLRIETEIDGALVPFIDLENLKRNKLASGRAKTWQTLRICSK